MRRIAIILAALSLIALSSCTDRRYYQVSGYAQGGTYTVKYRGASVRPEEVRARVDSLLRKVDFTLSGYNKNSLLSRLNRGDTVIITPMFAEIYRLSYEMWKLGDGAFDVACGPLFDIWGFGFTSGEMPSDDLVRSTLSRCGMSRLVPPDKVLFFALTALPVTGRELLARSPKVIPDPIGESVPLHVIPDPIGESVPPHVIPDPIGDLPVLNFNAIAQGYSCDLVFNMLRELGATDILVDIGEIRCCGLNPLGKGWSIGIDNPVDGNDKPGEDIRQVWTSDGGDYGVVTSGNYRKFYVRDGRKYPHTIDPRTGRPVEHDLLSATVIAPTAAEADALATMFMVIGFDASRDFLASRPDLAAYLITSDSVWSTSCRITPF